MLSRINGLGMPLEFHVAPATLPYVLVVDVVGVFSRDLDAAGAKGAGNLFGPGICQFCCRRVLSLSTKRENRDPPLLKLLPMRIILYPINHEVTQMTKLMRNHIYEFCLVINNFFRQLDVGGVFVPCC